MQTMTKAKKLWDSPFFSIAKTEKEQTLWQKMTPNQKWEVVGTFFLGIAATFGIIEYAFTPAKKQSSIVERFFGLLSQRESQRTESSGNSSSTKARIWKGPLSKVGIGERSSTEMGIDDSNNGWFHILRVMYRPEDHFRNVWDDKNLLIIKPYVFDGYNVQISRFFSAFLKQGDCFFDATYSALQYLPKESVEDFYNALDGMSGKTMNRSKRNVLSSPEGESGRFIEGYRDALSSVIRKSQDGQIVKCVMECFRLIGKTCAYNNDEECYKFLIDQFGPAEDVGGEIIQSLFDLFHSESSAPSFFWFWNYPKVESIDVGSFFDNNHEEPWHEQYWNEIKRDATVYLKGMIGKMDAKSFLERFDKFRSVLAEHVALRTAYVNGFEVAVAELVLQKKGIVLMVIPASQSRVIKVNGDKVPTEKTLHSDLSLRLSLMAKGDRDPRKCIILLNTSEHYYYADYTVV